ncbi:MAG TPA: hypothetical protein VK622_01930, partial [Puia sp.]|nr:hypothetical protein [Puia sp.]
LKDIIAPHLPSPYYHFEYNTDSLPSRVDFASGFSIYDISYNENKISEMRNNIIVNHDTLRYSYDPTGKLFGIDFINESNIIYRRVHFIYEGNLIKEIDWAIKEALAIYFIDRTVMFTFYPDGNVKTMVDHRSPFNGSPDQVLTSLFEQYDEKINVDDFSLIHDQYHDHLFLLQGFRLQKNNPGKETFTVNDSTLYTNHYNYVYNANNTPSNKKGDFLYISGPDAGKRFETNVNYTYY